MSKFDNIKEELIFSTSRSGGSGGQHVNKVESKVTLKFHINESQYLSDEEKKLVTKKLKNQINKNGFLVLQQESDRSQQANKKKLIKKFVAKLTEAVKKKKKRKPTKISKEAKEKRLKSKKRRSEIKEGRRKLF